MLDAVEVRRGTAGLSGEWREHPPCVVDFISGRSPFGPDALLRIERSLSVLDGLDLGTRTAPQIPMAIDAHVTGTVLHELRTPGDPG
jgi:hypothetical protein